jgi:hypothetical protein
MTGDASSSFALPLNSELQFVLLSSGYLPINCRMPVGHQVIATLRVYAAISTITDSLHYPDPTAFLCIPGPTQRSSPHHRTHQKHRNIGTVLNLLCVAMGHYNRPPCLNWK